MHAGVSQAQSTFEEDVDEYRTDERVKAAKAELYGMATA